MLEPLNLFKLAPAMGHLSAIQPFSAFDQWHLGGGGDSPQPPQHGPAQDENTHSRCRRQSMGVEAKRGSTQTDPLDQSGECEAML